jgi:hypothetical protein
MRTLKPGQKSFESCHKKREVCIPELVEVAACDECPFIYDMMSCQHPGAPSGSGADWDWNAAVQPWCPLRRRPVTIRLSPSVGEEKA